MLAIVDLEATCWNERNGYQSEIIEIGAVKYDPMKREVVSQFQSFVRPTIHPELSEFCTELTSIKQSDLIGSHTFDSVYNQFVKWFGNPNKNILASWGFYDKRMLEDECRRYGLPWKLGNDHMNMKRLYQELTGCKRAGLDFAVKEQGLEFVGTHHRAMWDAFNVANVIGKVLK